MKERLTFYTSQDANESSPLAEIGISAGFPSPAEDFKETRINLHKELVKHPDATFFARVSGNSMINAGLDDGDLLVIDRSLEPTHNKIAVCFIDGEFTVKRLKIKKNTITLMPENPQYKPIIVTKETYFLIWGVVTYVIKAV
jgi:DNA polymerase V